MTASAISVSGPRWPAVDVWGRLRFHDAHDRQAVEGLPALAGADLDEAMYAVTAEGAIDRGFFASAE